MDFVPVFAGPAQITFITSGECGYFFPGREEREAGEQSLSSLNFRLPKIESVSALNINGDDRVT